MIICRCSEVTMIEIKQFLKKHPHATLNDLKVQTTAGTNCGRCASLLEKSFNKLKNDFPQDKQTRISF